MDNAKIERFLSEKWDDDIVPQLVEYIRIPNKSPMFDPDWVAHGYMADAVELMQRWAKAQAIPGLQVEVVQLQGRTPLLYLEVPASRDATGHDTVLLYGHLDKQPEMTGWDADLGPWTPVLKGERLYGRGGADDGYALFGSLAAIQALQDQGIAHARCVVLIEACEESGSYDTTCLPMSITWRGASAIHRWWCAWTRAAVTTSNCGALPPCAVWPAAISASRC